MAINTWFYSDNGQPVDFSFCKFTGASAQFLSTHFVAAEVNFMRADFSEADADFTHSRFWCEAISFQYSLFGSALASFENSIFNSSTISFVNASFKSRNTVFRDVVFISDITEFHFAHFSEGNVSFDKSEFHGNLDFRKTEHGKGKLEFRRCKFHGLQNNFDEMHGTRTKTNFNRSVFNTGKISFEKSEMIDNELSFEQCNFGASGISFLGATFKSIRITGSQLNAYTDLRVETAQLIDLENCVLRDVLDLSVGETKLDIRALRMPGVRNLGMIIADYESNNIKQLITQQTDTTDFQKADQFRIFKEAFHDNGLYEDEDKATVYFKRYELKYNHQKRLARGGVHKIMAYPRKWFQLILFDVMGRYATDPVRVPVSMFAVYSLFSFLYFWMIEKGWGQLKPGADPPEDLSNIPVAFYHSAITFFTIGYGDYSPWGAARVIACLEGFIGVFLMAYFTVAFVRKILR